MMGCLGNNGTRELKYDLTVIFASVILLSLKKKKRFASIGHLEISVSRFLKQLGGASRGFRSIRIAQSTVQGHPAGQDAH